MRKAGGGGREGRRVLNELRGCAVVGFKLVLPPNSILSRTPTLGTDNQLGKRGTCFEMKRNDVGKVKTDGKC